MKAINKERRERIENNLIIKTERSNLCPRDSSSHYLLTYIKNSTSSHHIHNFLLYLRRESDRKIIRNVKSLLKSDKMNKIKK